MIRRIIQIDEEKCKLVSVVVPAHLPAMRELLVW